MTVENNCMTVPMSTNTSSRRRPKTPTNRSESDHSRKEKWFKITKIIEHFMGDWITNKERGFAHWTIANGTRTLASITRGCSV